MEVLDSFGDAVGGHRDRDGLAGLAGGEGDHPGGGGVVRAGRRRPVCGGVAHRDRTGRRRRQAHGERRHRASAGELDGGQVGHLGLVDCRPVVGENPAGVSGVGVPRPERPTEVLGAGCDVDAAVVVEVAGQIRRDGLEPDHVLGVLQVGAELAEIHRCDVLLVEISPHLAELGRQCGAEVRAREPRLRVDRVGVVVRRIHHAARHIQCDRPVPHPHQVAAPPVALTRVGADTLDEDQQVRVDRKCGVTGPFGGPGPVGRAAAAPGSVVGLVVQIESDHRGVVLVPPGQHRPVRHPGVLGVAAGRVVPQAVAGGARAEGAAVVVEDNPHTLAAGVGDDLVHHLKAGKTLQLRVFREVDSVGGGGGVQGLAGVGQPDGVETLGGHLVDHVGVAAAPQAVRGAGGGFQAEPVDPGDLHRVAGRVEDLVAGGVQETRGHRARTGLAHRGVGDAHTRGQRGGVVVDDGAQRSQVDDPGSRRVRQHQADGLVGLVDGVADDVDVHHLLGDPGGESEGPGDGGVVRTGGRGAVGGGVVNGDGGRRGPVQGHGEHEVRVRAVSLGDRGVADRQRRRLGPAAGAGRRDVRGLPGAEDEVRRVQLGDGDPLQDQRLVGGGIADHRPVRAVADGQQFARAVVPEVHHVGGGIE